MSLSPFEFDDYKMFLLGKIAEEPREGRGIRRQLAEFIGCQVAYVSHVLAGDRHFSPEQAEAASRFFSLREDESDYFLLLVDYSRAGTSELRRTLKKRIDHAKTEQKEIKKRIRIMRSISSVDQAQYYSSWHYQAVHSLITIPGFQNIGAIANRLKVSVERVNTIISFLLEKGLAKETATGLKPTESHIHLPRSSPLIGKLHTNWKIQALTALEFMKEDDYHYSGLITISAEDADKIREIMTKALAQSVEVAKRAKEEHLYVMAMDFYEL